MTLFILSGIIILIIIVRMGIHVVHEGRELARQRKQQRKQHKRWLEQQDATREQQAVSRGGRWVWVLLVLLLGVGGVVFWQRNYGGLTDGILQSRPTLEVAVQLPLSGNAAQSGVPAAQGIELAIETANAAEEGPRFSTTPYDDQGNEEVALTTAQRIIASDAALVLGPAFSALAMQTGPLYAEATMVSLPTNATSDLITRNATTYRVLFKNSDQGELIAHYIARVLEKRRVAVFMDRSSYGETLRAGFAPAAERLRLQTSYYVFSNAIEINRFAQDVANNPFMPQPAVVMFTGERDAARILVTLQRLGVEGPFFGPDTIGKPSFLELLKNQPEERREPGYFSRNLYALAPVILDSASREILDFAERYRARFGVEPDWPAVAGYDAATVAVAALRATEEDPLASRDLLTRRVALGTFLNRLSDPEDALPGLLGPLWFDQDRSRPQAIRVGRFQQGRFESAPVQLTRVMIPDPTEQRSGALFPLLGGGFAGFQTVVYTGIQLNEVTRLDLHGASFHADFYLWMRFTQRSSDPNRPDPTQIAFPTMLSGTFDAEQPLVQRAMRDGTEYYLWHVQGEFAAPFDVRRFPFDQQQLAITFFHPEATAEKLVYVVDQRVPAELAEQAAGNALNEAVASGVVAPEVLAQLEQWQPVQIRTGREDQVTGTLLGDPLRRQSSEPLERSGFGVTLTLARQAQSAVLPIVLPLLVMSLVLWLALLLPAKFAIAPVWLALLGALGGIVPLYAMGQQIGMIGYILPIINLFYVYFALVVLAGFAAFLVRFCDQHAYRLAAWRILYSTRIVYSLLLLYALALMGRFWFT
ncbi:MAG: hypothetical protein EI684_07230 [Candidatus Viridilinea halotolerans]|uniref:Leucine-binding protein domain-containing protein n=1 Tax=Candidatus Viridilinea halotolerans TaxID=2491704 RepID=A0A426U3G2_9CHLR|nr:MAG: hypothetical protein EI684_07230 [Candidatus Viridilinea halotolerans]